MASSSGPGPASTIRDVPDQVPEADSALRCHDEEVQRLARSRDDRVIAGVCAGIARRLGVDPVVVRLAAVVLALANAVGVVIYVGAWAMLPEQPATDEPDLDRRGERAEDSRAGLKSALAVGCITVGILILLKSVLPRFPNGLVWPATLVAVGFGVVWARADEADRSRWRGALLGEADGTLTGRGLWLRLACGGTLLICGFGWFLGTNSALSDLGTVGVAVLATILGIGVLLGPWVRTLFNQLGAERRERIRSEQRAEMAAHLHDSVLQTLALIQRQADSPQQSRSLARRQERELRAWLFDDRTPASTAAAQRLVAVLDQISDDVEADHDVTLDVVAVGDCPVDPRVEALVAAIREAVVNAAKHSGEPEVSVYVEVTDDGINAYVRDRGKGFDPAAVLGDRRGIADSIIGRMARVGGVASIRSGPGEGTEVVLRLPLESGEEE